MGSHDIIHLYSTGPGCLRTLALFVSAHPYCARKLTRHVMHERLRRTI